MTDAYLEIDGVRREYGSLVAVETVRLSVRRGEFMTFLGPSGSGKSTTLYIVAGLDQPTAGDVRIAGRSILATPPHRRDIGMVFQRYTLFPHLTVAENIAFPLSVRGLPRADVERRVKDMLRLVRLEGFADRRPSQMSGGQQQRVALARALIYDPPVLLMDEPLSALDKKLREEIQIEIRRIHRETGVTILYVTHDQEEALRLSDRIAVFSKGRVDQVGTGAELYANPATRFVAGFIGDSDFLACEILDAAGGLASLRLGGSIVIHGVPLHGSGESGMGTLMLRPERIDLGRSAETSDAALPAVVEDITFLGGSVHVATRTPWGDPVAVRLPFGHPAIVGLARGQTLRLGFDPAQAHCFR